jgi:hypothetical protein
MKTWVQRSLPEFEPEPLYLPLEAPSEEERGSREEREEEVQTRVIIIEIA